MSHLLSLTNFKTKEILFLPWFFQLQKTKVKLGFLLRLTEKNRGKTTAQNCGLTLAHRGKCTNTFRQYCTEHVLSRKLAESQVERKLHSIIFSSRFHLCCIFVRYY